MNCTTIYRQYTSKTRTVHIFHWHFTHISFVPHCTPNEQQWFSSVRHSVSASACNTPHAISMHCLSTHASSMFDRLGVSTRHPHKFSIYTHARALSLRKNTRPPGRSRSQQTCTQELVALRLTLDVVWWCRLSCAP